MITIALPTEIQYEAARAYVGQKPAPSALGVTIAVAGATGNEKNEAKVSGELDAESREWVFGLLDATNGVASDEALMSAYHDRATKKKSWFASIMASFGI